ncbi:MAG: PH domain-containing protein [Turicibacter sp.]
MSLFAQLAGNSVEVSVDKIDDRLKRVIFEGEQILYAFKSFRDYVVMTNKRLIISDVQGVTGSKMEYLTVPYSKISAYSLEAAGTFDMDVDFKVFVSGYGTIEKKIAKGVDVTQLSKILAQHIC